MKLVESVPVPCRGVDHMDFGANGRFLIASCEFAATLVKVDVSTRRPLGTLALEAGGMPQDVRSSPDGTLFYVADMMANGVYVIDPYAFSRVEFIPTGKGAHGISISRDAKLMYVSNRGEGSVSVIDLATRKPIAKWQIPAAAARTWAGCRPTARRSGCRAATTARSTRSIRGTAGCWRASKSEKGRTAWRSFRSRAGIRSDTTASFADGR